MKKVRCSRGEWSLWLAAEKQHRRQTSTRTRPHTHTCRYSVVSALAVCKRVAKEEEERQRGKNVTFFSPFLMQQPAVGFVFLLKHSFVFRFSNHTKTSWLCYWSLYEKRAPTGFCTKDFWSPYGGVIACPSIPGGPFSTHTTQFVRYSSKQLFSVQHMQP